MSDLPKADQLRLLPDILHRMILHHGLWFAEVRHQMGLEGLARTLHYRIYARLNRQSVLWHRAWRFTIA
jgi:hypothetical protein